MCLEVRFNVPRSSGTLKCCEIKSMTFGIEIHSQCLTLFSKDHCTTKPWNFDMTFSNSYSNLTIHFYKSPKYSICLYFHLYITNSSTQKQYISSTDEAIYKYLKSLYCLFLVFETTSSLPISRNESLNYTSVITSPSTPL